MESTCRDQVATGRSAKRHSSMPSARRMAEWPWSVSRPHRLVGQHAVCPATVGDDVLVVGQFGELVGEFIEGNRHRGGNVAGRVFLSRPHIDHRDVSGLDPLEKIGATDLLGSWAEVGVGSNFDIGQVGAGHRPHKRQQVGDIGAGDPVIHLGAVAAGAHQVGRLQGLQMRRRGAQAELTGAGQGIDCALALGQQVQQLQALSTAQGFADPGELIEQRVLGGPITHSILQSSLE